MSVFVGDQVQASTGEWSPPPTAFTFQWQRSADGATGWVDAIGAARSDYITDEGDVGLWLRCVVTASNVAGTSESVVSGTVRVLASPDDDVTPTTAVYGIAFVNGSPRLVQVRPL